ACHNILATKENLLKRHITTDDKCEECGKESEPIYHLFWFCDKAKEVWANTKLVFPFQIGRTWGFVDMVWQIVRSASVSPNLLEKVAAICWGIWKNRCEVWHGGHRRSSSDIARRSLIFLEEFQVASKLSNPPIIKENIKWSPPAVGRYKLNVDGANFSQIKATSLGMVLCDDAGLVVAAISEKISFSLGPLEAEAKAMEAAIQFAIDIGVREVTFETDFLLLYNALQGNNAATSSIENVVSGILFQIQNFRFAGFSHIKRLGNLPTHVLA
ncbi:putative ribonuclease h protein, partial [Quercus suber]